ncbi:MAG: T9SS type A sorting domain-containing protein [Bacteroidales bacterium]|nr:T9SS type A sorting domain-containing protein [Bacteroidales bacterium]
MKRFFAFLILACTLTAFAQQPTKTLTFIESFLYDSQGKETENHTYYFFEGQTSNPDKVFTYYDSEGKISEKVSINEYSDTTGKTTYSYENENITLTHYSYQGTYITPSQKEIYYGVKDMEGEHDYIADIIGVTAYACDSFQVYYWENTTWELSTTAKYTYANNQPTKLVLSLGDMGIDIQITYKYDTKENCTNMYVSVLLMGMPLSLLNIDQTFNQASLCTETYIYPNINPLLLPYLGEDFEDEIGEQKIRFDYFDFNKVKTTTHASLDKETGQFIDDGMQEFVYKQINSVYLVDTVYLYELSNPESVKDIQSFQVQVAPNPATDYISLEGIESASVVSIYDAGGKLVILKKVNTKGDSKINVEALLSGIYFIKTQNKRGISTLKFMKK